MIIENESNWRTDDLLALVERVRGIPGIRPGSHIQEDTLILFKTSRRTRAPGGYSTKSPPAGFYNQSQKRYYNTEVIELRSKAKLQQEVLDRLADVQGDGERDMSIINVKTVAKSICDAIQGNSWRSGSGFDYSWAKDCFMRTRPKIAYGRVAIDREIIAISNEQADIQRYARRQVAELDRKISKVRERRAKT